MTERNNNADVSYEIKELGGALDRPSENGGWTLEVNLVSWNGNKPKIDIRQWSPDHTRMARGITLTENQARNLARILGERYRDRSLSTPARSAMER